MKPGYKTSEFWLTLANTILMVLAGLSIISSDEAERLQSLLAPLIGAVLPIVAYIVGRSWVKRTAA